jgi:hypothetical protein
LFCVFVLSLVFLNVKVVAFVMTDQYWIFKDGANKINNVDICLGIYLWSGRRVSAASVRLAAGWR